jgi:magnesium transporter
MTEAQPKAGQVGAALDATHALKPDFIRAVFDAVDRGDGDAVRALLEPLHNADLADLLAVVSPLERRALVGALGGGFDPEILTEIDEDLKVELVAALGSKAVAEAVAVLDAEDAAYVLEDLPEAQKREVLDQVSAEDRADVSDALAYPDYSAGRLMHREFIALEPALTAGEAVARILAWDEANCPDEFDAIYIIDAQSKPVGLVPLSRLLRAPRDALLSAVMETDFKTVSAQTDQAEFAYLFEHYHLTSAPVVDTQGKLAGVLDAKSAFDVLQEEHESQVLALGGVSDGEGLGARVSKTTWLRFSWLFVNLLTAILASLVIGFFQASLEKVVALAILMPIVASMGGNAGTQTLTVAVRALATKDLQSANFLRVVGKELAVGALNGLVFAVIMGVVTWVWFKDIGLALVIAAAMVINLLAAASAGILVPMGLSKAGVDPAVSSAVFVTTVTDVVGFLAFLGLATWVLFS